MPDPKPFFRCPITLQRRADGRVDVRVTQRDGTMTVAGPFPDDPAFLSSVEAVQAAGTDVVTVRFTPTGSSLPPTPTA